MKMAKLQELRTLRQVTILVKITAYDKNNTPSTKSIRITVQDQLAGTATGKTVPEKTPVPANTKVVTPK